MSRFICLCGESQAIFTPQSCHRTAQPAVGNRGRTRPDREHLTANAPPDLRLPELPGGDAVRGRPGPARLSVVLATGRRGRAQPGRFLLLGYFACRRHPPLAQRQDARDRRGGGEDQGWPDCGRLRVGRALRPRPGQGREADSARCDGGLQLVRVRVAGELRPTGGSRRAARNAASQVLDIGCGSGQTIRRLFPGFEELSWAWTRISISWRTGRSSSPRMACPACSPEGPRTRSRLPRTASISSFAEASSAIHTSEPPSGEALRVLRPGGRFFFRRHSVVGHAGAHAPARTAPHSRLPAFSRGRPCSSCVGTPGHAGRTAEGAASLCTEATIPPDGARCRRRGPAVRGQPVWTPVPRQGNPGRGPVPERAPGVTWSTIGNSWPGGGVFVLVQNRGSATGGHVGPTCRRSRSRRCLYFCFADHFEPDGGTKDQERARRRVAKWVEKYPQHRDSEGRPPQYTFFYSEEEYDTQVLDQLASLCREGLGDVEVHLHHYQHSADRGGREMYERIRLLASPTRSA